MYRRQGACRPLRRRRGAHPIPSSRVRAISTPSRLAIDVPVTNRPLARVGKFEQLAQPVYDLPLDFDRHVIAAAEIGVEAGGQHLRQHAGHVAAAMHPTHEAGMGIAGGVRENVAHELVMHGGEIARPGRHGRLESGRALRPESAATPGARGCSRCNREYRRACGGLARGRSANPQDRDCRRKSRRVLSPCRRQVFINRLIKSIVNETLTRRRLMLPAVSRPSGQRCCSGGSRKI